jgi:hypothetical protein
VRIDYSTATASGAADTCLSIGASFLGECAQDGAGSFFKGMIDDFRIYGRALSAAEIKALYCPPGYVFYDRAYHVMRYCSDAGIVAMGPPGLGMPVSDPGPVAGFVSRWKLDESGATTTAADDVGTNNGTLTNFADPASAWQPAGGKLAGALQFDGVNDYVNTADNAAFSPANNNLTVSFWAKVPSSVTAAGNGGCGSSGEYLVSKGVGGNWEWAFENDSNNRFCFNLWQLGGTAHTSIATLMTMNDDRWHHYAATVDYLNEVILYVDAIPWAIATSFTGTMGDGTQPVQIGRRGDGNYFEGMIDDVRIYSRVLAPAEIEDLYGTSACANPARGEGVMIYNTNFNVMQYCDGTVWRKVGP